jgi:hypothetical protein
MRPSAPGKLVFDCRDQFVEPLPRERRYQYRLPAVTPAAPEVVEPLPFLGIEAIDLVPYFDQPRIVRLDAETAQHVEDVRRLRGGVAVRDVAHMEDDVGFYHLFESRAECRHQHGWQV